MQQHYYPARANLPADKEPAPAGFTFDLTTLTGRRAALKQVIKTEWGQVAAVAATGLRIGLLRSFADGSLFGKSEDSSIKAFLAELKSDVRFQLDAA